MKKNLFVIVIGMVMTTLVVLSAGIMIGCQHETKTYSEDNRVNECINEIKERKGFDSLYVYNTKISNWNGTDRVSFEYAATDESGNICYGSISEPLK